MKSGRAACGERGFALLEVLIAAVIASLCLIALFDGFSKGLQGVAKATSRDHALLVAQSVIDAAGSDAILMEGTASGSSPDGIAWQATTTRREDLVASPIDAMRVLPYEIVVDVRWQKGPSAGTVRLQTIKLGAR